MDGRSEPDAGVPPAPEGAAAAGPRAVEGGASIGATVLGDRGGGRETVADGPDPERGAGAGPVSLGRDGSTVVTVARSIQPATGAGGGGGGAAVMSKPDAAPCINIARAVTWFVRSSRREKNGTTASARSGLSDVPLGTPRE